ncbi:origin recognition complex subunit 5-like [Leptopilina boulardi]|uniref:origin recognition complex subunit 5-like n=1 Tax=Leptopilina boulardi TaxID=63433 RepID=UPI0021F55646|nr:origin recognition complex subunit 5-like [Leptopilina boulardi]
MNNWACIRYLKSCNESHDDKSTYIVPLSNVDIQGYEFDSKKSYMVQCFGDPTTMCKAIIVFIAKNTSRANAINRKNKKRLVFPSLDLIDKKSSSEGEEESDDDYFAQREEKRQEKIKKLKERSNQGEPSVKKTKKNYDDEEYKDEDDLSSSDDEYTTADESEDQKIDINENDDYDDCHEDIRENGKFVDDKDDAFHYEFVNNSIKKKLLRK